MNHTKECQLKTETMATIELSKTQLKNLLKLAYLGEWVLQAHDKDNYDKDLDDLEQELYTVAYNNGLDEDVEFDKKLGGYVPTKEFEEECDEDIEKYDENTFWEELIVRMSQLDLPTEEEGASRKEIDKLQNQTIKALEKEFKDNGLDNLILDIE